MSGGDEVEKMAREAFRALGMDADKEWAECVRLAGGAFSKAVGMSAGQHALAKLKLAALREPRP